VLSLIADGDKRLLQAIVQESGWALLKMEDADLERQCREIVALFPGEAARYRQGNERMMKHFVGQMMNATAGRCDPALVQQAFERVLTAKE